MINALYTASATARGGRNGKVTSSDEVLNLEVRTPKELGGGGGAYTNPEQLFAAGYAACFDSALNLVMRTSAEQPVATTVRSHVGIGKNGNGGFGLTVTLEVNIPGVSADKAEALVLRAHEVCPYSNAIKGNIDVVLKTSTVPAEEF